MSKVNEIFGFKSLMKETAVVAFILSLIAYSTGNHLKQWIESLIMFGIYLWICR